MTMDKEILLKELREMRAWLDRDDVIEKATSNGEKILKKYLNTRTENAVAISQIEHRTLEQLNQKLEPLSDQLDTAIEGLKETIDDLDKIAKTIEIIGKVLKVVAKAL